ncbi:bifunctional riboflavin kinase/FAD synthetase [Nitrosomonas supralitoralis]|uniref:Riboflavin biosynthesis protein n=1 Tax=Nitrosomonas supralitoralis TaxID=2116706 RepID=A0A2P7NT05_9PROT|nr:bifunctional riboflavin kinase/FAD synthetase [Nitrosomonas supralitoralis]PSJ16604.1 bifunctional riboflavin kinase/FAD synthetase [Nitrosomonas supralitoralis]
MHTWRKVSAHAKAPVALTIGNFDGVHLGHQAILSRLKDTANRLGLPACVMTFEPHPREFFAPDQAPARLTSLREKLTCLIQLEIDCIHICRFNYEFARITPERFITHILNQELHVRWLLVGDDFRFGAGRAGDTAMLQALSVENNFTVEVMASVNIDDQRVSSTAIRQALANGNLEQARILLGRPYSISGRVIDGDKLGKQLGFPTANIQLKHNRPPLSGIFVVSVYGANPSSPTIPLPGVASLGVRPTIHENGKPVLEVHLFDFNNEIYGQHLQVDFLHKLRSEEKYADINTLVHQIEKDVAQAKEFFMTTPVHFNSMCGAL